MVEATITVIASALSLVAASSQSIHLAAASNLLQAPSTPSGKPKASGSFFSTLIAVYQATGEAACCIGFNIQMRNDSHGFLTCAFSPALQPDVCWKG